MKHFLSMKISRQARNRLRWEAFTLVELLAVMAVIVVLIGVAAPVILRRNTAGEMTNATYQITGAVDRARAEAMARNSYRYIALEEAVIDGLPSIRIKTLGFRRGERFPGDASTTLQPLTPPLILSSVSLTLFPDGFLVRPPAEQNLATLSSSFRITVSKVIDNAILLELASNGQAQLIEAQADSSGGTGTTVYTRKLCHWVEIGLQPTRGSAKAAPGSTPNWAIIQIAGLTGQTQVYRP